MTTPTPDAKTVADKLTSIMFVEGYVGKENLEAVNFLFTQTLTQDRAATMTLLRERVDALPGTGLPDSYSEAPNIITKEDVQEIIDDLLGKE